MSNDTDAIYAEQRHATVLLIIGLFPNRLECTFGEPCAELSNRIPEELEFEPGQYRVGDVAFAVVVKEAAERALGTVGARNAILIGHRASVCIIGFMMRRRCFCHEKRSIARYIK